MTFDQLRFLVMKHNSTGYVYHDVLRRLVALSQEHQRRLAEACNTGNDVCVDDLERQLTSLIPELGISGIAFNHDPRGATVRLQFADGFSDSTIGGYGVPIELESQ